MIYVQLKMHNRHWPISQMNQFQYGNNTLVASENINDIEKLEKSFKIKLLNIVYF